MPTNDNDLHNTEAEKLHGRDAEHPGYETTDINVGGVIVFLAGLSGFLVIFFVFCFGMGKLINNGLEEHDGKVNKWNELSTINSGVNGKREDLATNTELQQRALQEITKKFPEPRLDLDDGLQATADLHAREDLLLEHYSTIADRPGAVRIPIEQAMEEIAKKGLPLAQQVAPAKEMAGDHTPTIQVPLTDGFARTGYELEEIEAREQKMDFGRAMNEQAAEKK